MEGSKATTGETRWWVHMCTLPLPSDPPTQKFPVLPRPLAATLSHPHPRIDTLRPCPTPFDFFYFERASLLLELMGCAGKSYSFPGAAVSRTS